MGLNIQTIREIRVHIEQELDRLYNKDEMNSLSSIIIKTITGHTKLRQYTEPELQLSKKDSLRIIEITKELKKEKPLQYILGETSFYNCRIMLNNSTLIPRPETEELTDLIIRENAGYKGAITDLCTGSGCIAIALAANFPGASVTGIDISEKAVEMADRNSLLNSTSVNFITADIFSVNSSLSGKCGIIVSNPPYVRDSEKKHMKKNVLEYEPPQALFVPDSDPLIFYRHIVKLSADLLLPAGKIYFEINESFGNDCVKLLADNFTQTEIVKDINGKDRFVKGIKHG